MADIEATEETAATAGTDRRTILFYSGLLIVLLNLVSPSSGFQVVPVAFILKNKLHLSASELATFSLWAGIPGYFSFAFGIVRDIWSPFGLGDRGYLLLFGALSFLLFAVFAFVDVTVPMMLAVTLLTAFCFLFTWSAWNGLGSVIGRQFSMSGQISALWNFVGSVTIFAGYTVGGLLSEKLEALDTQLAVRILFLLVGAVMLAVGLLGLWRPSSVYDHLRRDAARPQGLIADLKRLVVHRPIYPALICWLLWNFSPGGSTVLLYYLSNTLHGTDAQWGAYNAIFTLSFLPAFVLFGFLSPRYALSSLLWWGTVIAIPQMVPLLFVHTPTAVLIAAVPMGLMGGIANAAYMDLLMRSCPKGLEGTLMMLSWSMYALALNFGNLLGTHLYESGGFFICIAATTFVYALILPTLWFVPREVVARPDGA